MIEHISRIKYLNKNSILIYRFKIILINLKIKNKVFLLQEKNHKLLHNYKKDKIVVLNLIRRSIKI